MFNSPNKTLTQLAGVFVLAVLASFIAYPEIFLTFKTSFILFDDYLLEYFNTSIIASFMAQGQIQLWDYFGQMPFAYLFTTLGTFKFPNVLAAAVFYVLSPLSDHTGVLFHHVFAWVNLLTLLALRVVGIFLLLGRLIENRRIVALATVIGAVFYSQPAFYIGTFYQSFYPLIFYFIICFIESFQARYIAAAFCFFVISFSNSLIHTCYMYLGVHFFMVCALAWSIVFRRKEWGGFIRSMTMNVPQRLLVGLLLGFFAVIVLGPYVWMQKIGVRDVEFDVKNSRLGRMLDLKYYFHDANLTQADPQELFRRMTDFTVDSGDSFFCGLMLFALAVTGLFLGKDSRKWIFAGAILCVYLVNFPREGFSPGWAVHWLNALTYPFKSILRSYHMASLSVLFYLIIPLAATGAYELMSIIKARDSVSRIRMSIVLIIMAACVVCWLPYMPGVVRAYLLISSILFGVILLKLMFSQNKIWLIILAGSLGILLAADVILIAGQTKSMIRRYFKLQPFETIALKAYGKIGIDYPNPLIVPWRGYGASYFILQDALIGPLVGQPQNYFKHTNFMLNFLPIDGHNPRHQSYAGWVNDRDMYSYIQQNHRMMFRADSAVRTSDGMLGRIVQAGLSDRVIMVDDPKKELNLSDGFNASLFRDRAKPLSVKTLQGILSDGKQRASKAHPELTEVSIALPEELPDDLATSQFTEDRFMLRLMVQNANGQWQECLAVQGDLLRDCSFDVGHIKKGMLTMAFNLEGFSSQKKYMLVYPQDRQDELVDVFKHTFDDWGLRFDFPEDGWLVFQFPFDTGWRISIDGKDVPFYKVNKSFIGFPVRQGKHSIQLSYQQGSLLRPWLLVSVIFSTLGLFILLIVAIRWENAYNSSAVKPDNQDKGPS